ncbi:MAG: hypothetical protein R6X16_03555, partial [Anaerolineae bacterium]
SPLDWVSAGHRTAIAEATYAAAAQSELAKAVPLATMVGGAGSLKSIAPTPVPSAGPMPTSTWPATPTPSDAGATPGTPGSGYSGGLKRPGGPSTHTPVRPSGTFAAAGTTSVDRPPATSGTLVTHYVELPGGGVATLIQLPDLAILVDGGGSLTDGTLLDYLLSQGITHLDMVIVTRYDDAHAAELPGIIPLLAPDVLWVPDEVALDEDEQLLFDLEAEVGGDHYTPATGESYLYDDVLIECLYSPRTEGTDARSLAVRLTYGEMALLFAGDSEAERALTLTAFRPHAEALRLSHGAGGPDGLDAATATIYLEAVRPEFAIYTGGDPRATLLEGIREGGVPVYAIADYGTLRFVTDGYYYELEADRIPTPAP